MDNETDLVTAPETEATPTLSFLGSTGVHEFIRYFLASGIALAVDVGALTLLTSGVGVSYLISGAIAFLLGLAVVYTLSVVWVFEHRAYKNMQSEFLVFAGVGIVGLGINESVLWLLSGFIGLHYLVAKGASVILVFSWNFGARKYLLFRSR